MKPDDIIHLRKDFSAILTDGADIDVGMPDHWVESIRAALTSLRDLGDELAVENIRAIARRWSANGVTVGIAIQPSSSRSPERQSAILLVLARAQSACDAADKVQLGRVRAADIDASAAHYVRECLIGRRLVDARHVVFARIEDDEWTQAAFAALVADRVDAFSYGADVDGLDDDDRAMFLKFKKGMF